MQMSQLQEVSAYFSHFCVGPVSSLEALLCQDHHALVVIDKTNPSQRDCVAVKLVDIDLKRAVIQFQLKGTDFFHKLLDL